jgi:DNA-binding response OmpR family regulator
MKKTRILVVDDEAGICDVLKAFLTLRGYDVYAAFNKKEAIAMAEKARPHLVFLDIRLPDGSGIDIIPRIKEINASTKVIMLTALEDEANIKRAKLLGADDYVVKPFKMDFLKDVIMQKLSYLSLHSKEGK